MIRRINNLLPISEKIRLLNEFILELDGKIANAKFSKNELDNLYTQLAGSGFNLDRKYIRNVALGNTILDYTNWINVHNESGYSIWKYAPSNYAYSALNNLYLDNIALRNLGEATSESIVAFDKVFFYDGSTYTDHSTEAGSEDGTEFSLMDDTSDYLYVGHSTTFKGIDFEFQTRGSGYVLALEYWNGSAWVALSESADNLVDNTSDFIGDGAISWDIPGGWATVAVNSSTKYWIRIKTSSAPTTIAKAYLVIPTVSVVGLLKLSSEEIIAGDWAFCSYGGYVYVTLRNAGSTAYEGDYFITSSSTTVNKQNYFVYNHQILSDYLDSTYSGA